MGDAAPERETFTIKEATIENLRHLKVIVIGAGFSGILAAIRIPEKLRNVELVVYEKNEKVGGVWWMNKYPGVACDIPSHSYQYSFAPNPNWSDVYAPGAEIQQYLEGVADKFGASRFIKTKHEVKKCVWDEEEKKWNVTVEDLATGDTIEDSANFLVTAKGLLSDISWPEIPGFNTFKGMVMHSGAWDESHDFSNQKVGIIGNGSSAIQIVPRLQKLEGVSLTCFGRSPTWISPLFGDMALTKAGMDPGETKFSKELRQKWSSHPDEYQAFRKLIESEGNAVHEATLRGTPMQQAGEEHFRQTMQARLALRPDLFTQIVPKFMPGCRRLTPGPGYLEALCQPNVEFVGSSRIIEVTPTGVTLADGREIALDALVCATGFRTSSPPPFPVVGRGSLSLAQRWQRRPETYLSVAVDGFPNMMLMFGPNSAIGSGSLTMILETQGAYIVNCIRKLQKEDYASIEVKPERVADFQEYCGKYFERTVYTDECESWYKTKGDKWISALWPGSTLQALEAFRAPRWEDFNFESVDNTCNLLRWLGNGWSTSQYEGDPSWYINPQFVDIPQEDKPEDKEIYKMRPYSY